MMNNRLLQLIDGKRVAVVGNAPVEADVSAEVDAADVVIRFNNMYRYGEGRTGKKISIVMQTFTCEYMWAKERHNAEILRQRPEIFLVKQRGNYSAASHSYYGPEIRVNDIIGAFAPWSALTTGGAALCFLAEHACNSEFKVYGFSSGDGWKDYVGTEAHWYAATADAERKAVDEAIAKLEAKRIAHSGDYTMEKRLSGAKDGIPRVIVVPVHRRSSGAPGKNRALLFPLLDKLASLPYRVVVLGDDDELLYSAEQSYPFVIAFHTPQLHSGNTEDITFKLQNWRIASGYCGDIALVQCTSPGLRPEWIEDCFEESKKCALVATAVKLDFKPNAIYKADYGGVWTPYQPNFGAASTARQNLPVCCRITGAVEVFHSDALDFGSFWQAAYLRPYFVDAEDSLDVDTSRQLKEALP